MCRRCARWTRHDGTTWFHIDDGTIACVDPDTLHNNTGEATTMTTTRDSKGRIQSNPTGKAARRKMTADARKKSTTTSPPDETIVAVADRGKSPKGAAATRRATTTTSPAQKSPRATGRKSTTTTTPPPETPETTPEAVSWPVPSHIWETQVARNLNVRDEFSIPLPPDDEIMATDVAMLVSNIWKAHKATGGTVENQPDIINRFNNWKKAGRIMAGKTTTTKGGGNGTRALSDNAATDAEITKAVRAELKDDPTFTAWSRIVRALRAEGKQISRVRVETILDAERKAMPKGATKAATTAKSAEGNGHAKPAAKKAPVRKTAKQIAAEKAAAVKATAHRKMTAASKGKRKVTRKVR